MMKTRPLCPRCRMKWPLWLFLAVLLSALDPEHFVNGALESVRALSTSEDCPPVDITKNVALDCYDIEDEGEHHISIFMKKQRGLMTKVTTKCIRHDKFIHGDFKPLEDIGGFLLRNISCILTTELSCTWSALNSPPDAHYSVALCQKTSTICHCVKRDGRVIGCHGNIEIKEDLTVHINVSSENFWYIHSLMYDPESIVKLSPPQNISASIISGALHMKWEPPIAIRDKCLLFQFRIHTGDEPRNLTGSLREHIEHNVDVSKSHFVQMRVTKTSNCVVGLTIIWSDWSPVVEVAASEKPYDLNAVVIASIALGIPMTLLTVLLVCRCQSLMDKLCPIPSPSIKVQQLLEKDDFMEVLPAKSTSEEITEVSFVGNDKCAKI
ncbi:hypothetical protein SKAU_G00260660 [Synaphobranchus kaupii]|uniref:Uncharacterized protein n=1 Tax=Synaphobranchus kaupii TaxID=118154 RepID=A0A9Q1F4W4_SYNKA|nr:hypothetical protein SKAU_G00260660 [Synaphobranchus kaupii]